MSVLTVMLTAEAVSKRSGENHAERDWKEKAMYLEYWHGDYRPYECYEEFQCWGDSNDDL